MTNKKQGLWARLRRPSTHYSIITILGIGFVVGILSLALFLGELKATAKESFCISCHEMETNVWQEYQNTPHFNSRSGVRPICSDCHLAHDLIPKIARKAVAIREVYHKLLGTIDTREKFEDHRLVMAQRVWAEMKANDSRECRSCHDARSMDYSKQSRRAMNQHINGDDEGQTCIDCHKGIAHVLPEMDELDPSAVIMSH